MDWSQILFLFFSNAALILWFRAESRADWRHMDAKVDAWREETFRQIECIHEEMKDFHQQLLNIESRRK